MAQFLGYTLELELFDEESSKIKGTITSVFEKTLNLSNVEYLSTGKLLDNLQVSGDKIKDLTVVQLPGKGKGKAKKSEKKPLAQRSYEGTPELDDEAVLKSTPIQSTPIQSTPKSNSTKGRPRKNEEIDWDTDEEIKQDFDFQSNLNKFDKSSVFKQLSEIDKVDPSNRLVSHNTNNNNYAHDEMVLKPKSDTWNEPIGKSIVQPKKQITPQYAPSRTPTPSHKFSMINAAKEAIPLCSPVQLLEIERVSIEEYSLTQDLITENCARGVCKLVLDILGGKAGRISNGNHNAPPLALILVGNNRSGSRALAVGRHLINHGVRVIAICAVDEQEDELISTVSKQLNLFTKFGGKTAKGLKELKKMLSKLDSPLEFVLDGLQGFDNSIGDLIDSELSMVVELVEWCNYQKSSRGIGIMSLDISSGMDAGSGHYSLDSDQLRMQSKWVVSIGLPLSSLLNAYTFGTASKGELIHYLVDVGYPRKIFFKGSLRKFDRLWFGSDFVEYLEVVQ